MTSFDPPTIRPLAYADLPQVIAIERRAFTTPWSLAMFVLELSKPSGVCLAAVDSRTSKLVGYLVCSRYDTVWHLMNVAVEPALRRRGIAWALLEEMIRQAGPEQQYTLEVRMSNAPAIALYERLHFRSAGKRPRYYRDNGEDAVIMWRTAETVLTPGAAG
jgi:[ribosomal protein S18]-alanine N-acetyltransferase